MKRLVVGVDGSEAAQAALHWAADTVGPEGVIHAIVAVDPALEFLVDVVTGDTMTYLQRRHHDLASTWTRDATPRVRELTAEGSSGSCEWRMREMHASSRCGSS